MRLRIEVCPRPLHMYLRICGYSCTRPCRKHRIDVVFKSLWYESRHWLLRFIARMLRVEISVCFFHSHHSVTEWLTHTPKKKYYNPRKINLLSSMLKQSKLGLVCESVVPVDLYCRACRARCRGRLSNVQGCFSSLSGWERVDGRFTHFANTHQHILEGARASPSSTHTIPSRQNSCHTRTIKTRQNETLLTQFCLWTTV